MSLVVHRIIDANLNRLREGLRRLLKSTIVLVKNNSEMSGLVKDPRHSVTSVIHEFSKDLAYRNLLDAREVLNDVLADHIAMLRLNVRILKLCLGRIYKGLKSRSSFRRVL